MSILYGSETGTAEDVAYITQRSLDMLREVNKKEVPLLCTRINSLASYDITSLPSEQNVVFVVSTTGDGEVPEGMKKFWKFLLQKNLGADSLKGVKVAIFGLGDSSYEKYNACARKLSSRLKQLGSSELVTLGLGDDRHTYGYLSGYNKWIQDLREKFGGKEPSSAAVEETIVIIPSPSPSRYDVETSETDDNGLKAEYKNVFDSRHHRPSLDENSPSCPHVPSSEIKFQSRAGAAAGGETELHLPPTPSQTLVARVALNERMTGETWPQDVRRICLDLSAVTKAKCASWPLFVAGDVAVVSPVNAVEWVDRMLQLEQFVVCDGKPVPLKRKIFLSIKRLAGSPGSEVHRENRVKNMDCSLFELFSRRLDISGIPGRSFFTGLSAFASNEEEAEKLQELGDAEGTGLYYEYCLREKRTFVEVMEEFPSARPPLDALLELIPSLRPRSYSIATTGYTNPTNLELCVAVTESTTPYNRTRTGICSGYLARTVPGKLNFRGGSHRDKLLLYTGGVLIHLEWYIRQL